MRQNARKLEYGTLKAQGMNRKDPLQLTNPDSFHVAFPDEIPSRLIKLFTFVGETVFDPFLGSGTTLKVARELGRKGIGYEIDLELKDVIRKKLGLDYHRWTGEDYLLEEKTRARNLRKTLQTKVRQQKSVAS